jgi:hypothetical protein
VYKTKTKMPKSNQLISNQTAKVDKTERERERLGFREKKPKSNKNYQICKDKFIVLEMPTEREIATC